MLLIPNEARWELSDLHERKSKEQYLDAIWARRDAEYSMLHGMPIARGQWPFVRAESTVIAQFKPKAKRA